MKTLKGKDRMGAEEEKIRIETPSSGAIPLEAAGREGLSPFSPLSSPLLPLHPLTWLAGNVLFLLFVLLWTHPLTPVLALVGVLGAGKGAGVSLRDQLHRLKPYLVMAAFWFVTSVMFYGPSPMDALSPLLRGGPIHIVREAVDWGALRAFRLLDMIAFGSLALACIRPDDLALGLAQGARVPYRLAFALQAAYRMVPLLSEEAETLRRARRVRGIPPPQDARSRWEEWMGIAGPLLAGALRRADRLALAMESRGFGAYPTRTYRRDLRFHLRDGAAFVTGLFFMALLTLLDRNS